MALSVGVRLVLSLVELAFIGAVVYRRGGAGDRPAPPPRRRRAGRAARSRWAMMRGLGLRPWSPTWPCRPRHDAFWTGRFDLGNMVQAVWSTAHGRPLETTDVTGDQFVRLGAHVDPILVLFTPLAWTGALPRGAARRPGA